MAEGLVPESAEKAQQTGQARQDGAISVHSLQNGVHPILRLQRILGNRSVADLIRAGRLTPQGIIRGLQPKLTVGPADDQFEQEADRVAHQVLNAPEAPARLPSQQRKLEAMSPAGSITPFGQGYQEDVESKPNIAANSSSPAPRNPTMSQPSDVNRNEPLQARSDQPALTDSFEVGAEIEAQIRDSKGQGGLLPDSVRAYMEPRFGSDFGNVRVHTDDGAAQMNQALGAQAFTLGSDIYYGQGHSPAESHLTAHELTHVLQQEGGAPHQTTSAQRAPLSDPDPFSEPKVAKPEGRAASTTTEQQQTSEANLLLQRAPQPNPAPSSPGPSSSSAGIFDPEVTRAPDGSFAYPSDEVDQDVEVKNASKAPPGTKFFWRWSHIDAGKLAPQGRAPADGPHATLKAIAKEVSETNVTSEVHVTPPGGTPFTKQTPPAWVSVMAPNVNWGSPIVVYGKLAPGKPRSDDKIYVGDTLYISAEFKDMKNPKEAGLRPLLTSVSLAGQSGDFTWHGDWVGDRKYGWEIKAPTGAGHRSFRASFSVPGMADSIGKEFDLTAVATADFFKARCSTAESTLNTLHAAGREWFMSCFLNYKKAYENHTAALKEQSAADQLVGSILLTVLFGVIGGAAGGAVGGALESSKKAMQQAIGNTATGALTDAAKDLTKAVARIPTQFKGGGGGGKGATSDKATTNPGGASGMGQTAAAAIDPLNWMAAIDKGIAGERKAAGEQVVEAHQAADECIANNPSCEFDWDPVEVVTEGAKLDGKSIGNLGEVPSELEYERAFWEVWLNQYAYKFHYTSDVLIGSPCSVTGHVGGKLKDRIQVVASKFGETADQWIERYGAPALKAAQEAENQCNSNN